MAEGVISGFSGTRSVFVSPQATSTVTLNYLKTIGIVNNGYNGRGLAIGTALGGVLARRVLGAAPEALPFPTTPLTPSPFSLPAAARFYWRKWWRRR